MNKQKPLPCLWWGFGNLGVWGIFVFLTAKILFCQTIVSCCCGQIIVNDKINELTNGQQYEVTATEIKVA